MTHFRQRLFSQGITLEQFAFQVVVVLLGVYLAIVFESKAEDRSRASDARAMLVDVLGELELDEAEIEQVRPAQVELEEGFEILMDLLATASPTEEWAIDSLIRGPLAFSPTVFPRRAAYTALVASGDMRYLPDTDLALRLTDLYEHHYVRLMNHGDWTDKEAQERFWPTVNSRYWDKKEGRLIQRGREANVGFWNGADHQRQVHGTYGIRLDSVLEELRAVKASLELYLNE